MQSGFAFFVLVACNVLEGSSYHTNYRHNETLQTKQNMRLKNIKWWPFWQLFHPKIEGTRSKGCQKRAIHSRMCLSKQAVSTASWSSLSDPQSSQLVLYTRCKNPGGFAFKSVGVLGVIGASASAFSAAARKIRVNAAAQISNSD